MFILLYPPDNWINGFIYHYITGIVVPERHLKHLRSRCETLGIVHPNMPVDPLEWVTHMKQLRRNGKNRNQRSMNTVKGALFGK